MVKVQRLLWNGLWATLAILTAGSVVVLVTGIGEPVRADPPKSAPDPPHPPPSKEQLDALLKDYKRYELPMPPADAPLVRTATGTRSYSKGAYIDHYGLGFLIKSPRPGDPNRVYWRGGRTAEVERRQVVTAVEPRPESLNDTDDLADLELAVVCHARGWTDLALKVLERNLRADRPAPETELARSAWHHWLWEFRKPETDRAKVARLLQLIWERRQQDFHVHDRNLLDSLQESLKPGKGKPGTVEALIDDLIEVTHTDRTDALAQINKPHPAYVNLARRGFEAVPALIEHLNDERLTRAYKHGFNNFRGYHYHVADVVCDLLQGLAGEDLGKDWLRRLQGYRLEKAQIEKWWAEAQKVGEEAYFVRQVLGDEKEGNLRNRPMLDVLAHKYPKQLPALYRKMLNERPGMYGWEMADAVARSTLPDDTKRELFGYAATTKVLRFRQDAIGHLRKLDPPKALRLLVTELDNLPVTPAGAYWACPESGFAHFVRDWNEPAAWAALEKAARRADAGLRLEILNNLGRRDVPAATRKAALAFLAKFLDDDEVRVAAGSRYDGPSAGDNFRRIEVRNFAAHQIAWVLELDVEPKPNWTDDEWAKLRDDVRKALTREGIK